MERWQAAAPFPQPTPAQLREAFRWSEHRTVTKTATVSLHSNIYNVDAALVGRKVELVFDPFDLTEIEVRFHNRPFGLASPHRISQSRTPQGQARTPQSVARAGHRYRLPAARRHRPHRRTRTEDQLHRPDARPAEPGLVRSGSNPVQDHIDLLETAEDTARELLKRVLRLARRQLTAMPAPQSPRHSTHPTPAAAADLASFINHLERDTH